MTKKVIKYFMAHLVFSHKNVRRAKNGSDTCTHFDDKVCGVKGISRLLISEYCHVVNLKILPFLKKILIFETELSGCFQQWKISIST